MVGGVIGRRYAKALLGLAGTKKDDIKLIEREIEEIAEAYQKLDSISAFMANPSYNRQQKTNFIDAVTKKMNCSEIVNKFCRFLAYKNRFAVIGEIASAYRKIGDELLGVASANVTVAFPITGGERKTIQKSLETYTGKQITLTETVDPEIMGGAITSIGSLVLDGSVKNQLNLLRESISKG